MGIKLRSLVAGAALLGLSSTASAAFFYIPLWQGATQSNDGTSTTGPAVALTANNQPTMTFNIPVTSQNLVATALPTTATTHNIKQTTGGIGTNVTSCGPDDEVDNCGGVIEGVRFTLTSGPIVGFRLAAVQFAGVDSNDQWALNINGAAQALGGNNELCPPGGNGPSECWVHLLPVNFASGTPGQAAGANQASADLTLAANNGTTSTSFDIMAPNDNTGLGSSCGGLAGLLDPCDDWKIKAIVWEIIDQPVPEPASMALLGAALLGLGFARRRKIAK